MSAENVVIAGTGSAVKTGGYLEKKGKLKMVTMWKRYWFVLDGRLLLYYRSLEEYETLSPCKGSINLGLVLSVRPALATTGVFHIVTRTQIVTLRAKDRTVEERWLQALLDATGPLANVTPTTPASTVQQRMNYFRYSMDDLMPGNGAPGAKHAGRSHLARQCTLPHRRHSIVERIRQLGGKTDAQNTVRNNATSRLRNMQVQQQGSSAMATATTSDPNLTDYNRNCCIIESEQYIKSDVLLSSSSSPSLTSSSSVDDEQATQPELPPRPTCTKFSWFRRRRKNIVAATKKHFPPGLITRIIGQRKKTKANSSDSEPIYDVVEYCQVNNLQHNRHENEMLQDPNQHQLVTDNFQKSQKSKAIEINKSYASNERKNEEQLTEFEVAPCLPPRQKFKKMKQTPNVNNYSLDEILNDLEAESRKSDESTVGRLIEKFNQHSMSGGATDEGAVLRRANGAASDPRPAGLCHSNQLHALLEELAKVTSAPLLLPGVTSSLVHVKSNATLLTDEQWLALAPIRRRRHSDPDYDVPRVHRSLQLNVQPQSPDTAAMAATRFFGPVLPLQPRASSIAPDSLDGN